MSSYARRRKLWPIVKVLSYNFNIWIKEARYERIYTNEKANVEMYHVCADFPTTLVWLLSSTAILTLPLNFKHYTFNICGCVQASSSGR